MAWWGKLIGGTLGFMMGGPLGALLGTTLGLQFDANRRGGGMRALPGGQERTQLAFFTATFQSWGISPRPMARSPNKRSRWRKA